MELALKHYCPNTFHEKPNGLCKPRLVEKRSCFETFGELYEHDVTCLDDMVNSHMYPVLNESLWNWYRDTKSTAHGLKSSL